MDSQYLAYLSKEVIDTSVQFIRILEDCKIKLGVKLVPLSLLRKINKLQTTARYQRIEYFMPGVLDHHIEDIIQCTFQRIGQPMPNISATLILEQLIQHGKKRRRETNLNKEASRLYAELLLCL